MKPFAPALTDPVRLAHCHRCGRPILRAHADGLDVRCDPAPATTATELASLLAGRRSYDLLARTDGHLELDRRWLSRIRAPRTQPVVISHECTAEISTDQARRLPDPVVLSTKSAVRVTGDAPPF